MKAIIIEEKDSKALLDRLELQKFRKGDPHPGQQVSTSTAIGNHNLVTLGDMHRWFHYVVTKWLQEQGADGLQK